MIEFRTVLALGAISGFTIYIGLVASRLRNLKTGTRYILSSIATGILIFLIYDVLNGSWSIVEGSFIDAPYSGSSYLTPVSYALLFFLGLSLGIIGLSLYEKGYLAKATGASQYGRDIDSATSYRLSLMIAVGIGTHNFGEGLAIGSSYASGAIALATVLVIGFGLHNSTEGFGILGPLIRHSESPSLKFLGVAGLIGGGPTFFGTVIGSMWSSNVASILFLSFAAGALVYVTLTMYKSISSAIPSNRLMTGIFIGMALGFFTDLIVTLGGA